MCGYIHADVNMNLDGPAKVKRKSKSMELYTDKVRYIHVDVNMNHCGPAKVKCKSKSTEL